MIKKYSSSEGAEKTVVEIVPDFLTGQSCKARRNQQLVAAASSSEIGPYCVNKEKKTVFFFCFLLYFEREIHQCFSISRLNLLKSLSIRYPVV